MKHMYVSTMAMVLLTACGGQRVEPDGNAIDPSVYTHGLCSGERARTLHAPYEGRETTISTVYVTLRDGPGSPRSIELHFVSPSESDPSELDVVMARFEGVSEAIDDASDVVVQPFKEITGGITSSQTYSRDGEIVRGTGSGPVPPGYRDRWRGWLRAEPGSNGGSVFSLCAEQLARVGSQPERAARLLYVPADSAQKPWRGHP